MINIENNLPSFYNGITEMEAIMTADNIILQTAYDEMENQEKNLYPILATDSGLKLYESILSIYPDYVNDTFEFRKERVMQRLATAPPFSVNFLKKKLDSTVGEGLWQLSIDSENLILTVSISAENQLWSNEIQILINNIRPANLVYVNSFYLVPNLEVGDGIERSDITYNYILGDWLLDENELIGSESNTTVVPFLNPEYNYVLGQWQLGITNIGEVGEVAAVESITDILLNKLALEVGNQVFKVTLNNDSYEVTGLVAIEVVDNVATFEYTVEASEVSVVTNIRVYNSTDELISDATVYIPVANNIMIRHNVTIEEVTT